MSTAVHLGIVASLSVSTGGGGPTGTTQLLLHFDAANGSTTITDSSNNALTTASVNGQAAVSNVQVQWGNGSILMDGAGDNVVWNSNNAFNFSNATAFGIACWIRPANNTTNFAILTRYESNHAAVMWLAGLGANGTVRLTMYADLNGASSQTLYSDVTFNANAWHHVFWGGDGANIYVGLDGVVKGQVISVPFPNGTANLRLGCVISGGGTAAFDYNGYIDDVVFRTGTGACLYPANYSVPTGPYSP